MKKPSNSVSGCPRALCAVALVAAAPLFAQTPDPSSDRIITMASELLGTHGHPQVAGGVHPRNGGHGFRILHGFAVDLDDPGPSVTVCRCLDYSVGVCNPGSVAVSPEGLLSPAAS